MEMPQNMPMLSSCAPLLHTARSQGSFEGEPSHAHEDIHPSDEMLRSGPSCTPETSMSDSAKHEDRLDDARQESDLSHDDMELEPTKVGSIYQGQYQLV